MRQAAHQLGPAPVSAEVEAFPKLRWQRCDVELSSAWNAERAVRVVSMTPRGRNWGALCIALSPVARASGETKNKVVGISTSRLTVDSGGRHHCFDAAVFSGIYDVTRLVHFLRLWSMSRFPPHVHPSFHAGEVGVGAVR